MRRIILMLAIMLSASWGFAQIADTLRLKALDKIALPSEHPNWITFKKNMVIEPTELFIAYKDAFGLTKEDDMKLIEISDDSAMKEMQHYLFQQYHQGYKIWGATFLVHTKNNVVETANGRIASNLRINALEKSTRKLSEQNALSAAMKYAGGKKILPLARNEFGKLVDYDKKSFALKGELVWTSKKDSYAFLSDNPELCWMFDIWVDDGESRQIFINANTGDLTRYIPLSIQCSFHNENSQHSEVKTHTTNFTNNFEDSGCSVGTGTTTWHGKKPIVSEERDGLYYLDTHCPNNPRISVRNMRGTNSTEGWTHYTNRSNIWNSENLRSAVQTKYALAQAQLAYRIYFDRDSWDGDNASIVAYNNAIIRICKENVCTDSPTNATWNGNHLKLGIGNDRTSPYDDFNTVDIVGHEFTHGVVQETAGLIYQGESGALNESFADIFGEFTEWFSDVGINSPDWLMGADIGAIRSLINPNDKGDPNTYKGTYWIDTEDRTDNGGVHTNSGVQNYAFYLLSQGGDGVNDNNDVYSVKGIGIKEASEIAYRALSVYLRSMLHATFTDAREAFIRAAQDLHGSCSEEAIQTARAWFAVGVGRELAEYNQKVCGTKTDGLFQGVNSLQAGGNCTTQVNAKEHNVSFAAGNFISLKPGFTASVTGSNRFLAYVRPCSFTLFNALTASNTEQAYNTNELILSGFTKHENSESSFESLPLNVFPNPFKSVTNIAYTVPNAASISIDIFDINGKPIQNLVNLSNHPIGQHQVQFDGSQLPPGIYFCRLTAGSEVKQLRLVIAR